MSDGNPILLLSGKPGVKKDGRRVEAEYYTESVWCRFNRLGRPRKMNGYSKICQLATGPVYGFEVIPNGGYAYIFSGSDMGVEMQTITLQGIYAGGPYNRTVSGGVTVSNAMWSFDTIYDPTGLNAPVVLAHGGQNLANIDSDITSSTYYGSLTVTTPLVDSGAPQASGGVVVLHPYVFVYGSNGQVAWSGAGLPATWSGNDQARITGSKIVYAAPVRGGAGQAPAGLFWSLDSLVRATYVGAPAVFNFDTITAESSIMSSRCVIEMDGIFYWIGTDRFLFYNGIVKELPNQLNSNDFFANINLNYRQKVWGTKVPRWGEVWWFYPRGTSTKANWAVIYNVNLQTWYDTPIPENGRSDGYFAQVVPNPIFVGVEPDALDKYAFWLHETKQNFDKVENGVASAIQSYFVTQDINYVEQGRTNNVRLTRVELDLNQAEDMTVYRVGYAYPRSVSVTESSTFSITDTKIDDIRSQARYLFLKFESNVAGGFYEMGDCRLWLDRGDVRPGGG